MPVETSTNQTKVKRKLSNSQKLKIVVIIIYLILIASVVGFVLIDKDVYGETVKANSDDLSQIQENINSSANDLQNQNLNQEVDEWIEIVSVDLPLAESGYYQGGYENARRGTEEINEIGEINTTRTYRLIADKYMNIAKNNGYVDTQYPNVGDNFGYGVCWAVSALGYAQDEANKSFRAEYGVDLFEFPQRTGHINKYDTYASVNNGYGWAVYQSKNLNKDYSFRLSQNAINLLDNLSVKIELISTQNSLVGAHGESLSARIMIKFDGLRN